MDGELHLTFTSMKTSYIIRRLHAHDELLLFVHASMHLSIYTTPELYTYISYINPFLLPLSLLTPIPHP
jgi:hypothetical protein